MKDGLLLEISLLSGRRGSNYVNTYHKRTVGNFHFSGRLRMQ
jgi:hypothetical protein